MPLLNDFGPDHFLIYKMEDNPGRSLVNGYNTERHKSLCKTGCETFRVLFPVFRGS